MTKPTRKTNVKKLPGYDDKVTPEQMARTERAYAHIDTSKLKTIAKPPVNWRNLIVGNPKKLPDPLPEWLDKDNVDKIGAGKGKYVKSDPRFDGWALHDFPQGTVFHGDGTLDLPASKGKYVGSDPRFEHLTLQQMASQMARRIARLNEGDGGEQHYVIVDVYSQMLIMKESDGPHVVFSYKGEVHTAKQDKE